MFVCVCVCIPILVTTFPEWLSGTEPLPHMPGAVRPRCVCSVLCAHAQFCRRSVTLQSSTATLILLFSSSELTGCGYPGLLDRKNRSDMCPRWESNPRLPACKASTLSIWPGFPFMFLLLWSHSPNDVPPVPQRNVSMAAVRGAVRPSI